MREQWWMTTAKFSLVTILIEFNAWHSIEIQEPGEINVKQQNNPFLYSRLLSIYFTFNRIWDPFPSVSSWIFWTVGRVPENRYFYLAQTIVDC